MNKKMLRLRGKIIENGTTQEAVADSIGINPSTWYRKVRTGGKSFTTDELRKMMQAIPLSLDEVVDIFLSDLSQ